MSTPVVSVNGLAKRYGELVVFAHVSLQVEAGQFIAIVGESGVGKSTLLNCMAGLDDWDEGDINLCGHELSHAGEEARALVRRRHVGFVFQAFHVLPHLDVAQNVALPLMLLGSAAHEREQRVAEMLRSVGLEGLGHRLPQQLSGGQLQRVAIARALVHRPALLLADEPTGNLDTGTAARIMDLLVAQTHEKGAALVLVTHSEAAAQRAHLVMRMTSSGLQPLPEVGALRHESTAGH